MGLRPGVALALAVGLALVAVPAIARMRAQDRGTSLSFAAVTASSDAAPALGGVDVVAYFSLASGAAPVQGSATYSTTLATKDGLLVGNEFAATFWFASAANLASFLAAPYKYAPRFGGFCSYGISSEYYLNGTGSMATAGMTAGWPWARDYLGPPGNTSVWAVLDGSLYLAFLQPVMDVFAADLDQLSAAGEARWAEWYGGGTELHGPFNSDCLSSGYTESPTRTCTFRAQKLHGIASRQALSDHCVAALEATCGSYRGDDPVAGGACSLCLLANATTLGTVCDTAASDGMLTAHVDKVYCW